MPRTNGQVDGTAASARPAPTWHATLAFTSSGARQRRAEGAGEGGGRSVGEHGQAEGPGIFTLSPGRSPMKAAESTRQSSAPGATTPPIAYSGGIDENASRPNEHTVVRFARASDARVSSSASPRARR